MADFPHWVYGAGIKKKAFQWRNISPVHLGFVTLIVGSAATFFKPEIFGTTALKIAISFASPLLPGLSPVFVLSLEVVAVILLLHLACSFAVRFITTMNKAEYLDFEQPQTTTTFDATLKAIWKELKEAKHWQSFGESILKLGTTSLATCGVWWLSPYASQLLVETSIGFYTQCTVAALLFLAFDTAMPHLQTGVLLHFIGSMVTASLQSIYFGMVSVLRDTLCVPGPLIYSTVIDCSQLVYGVFEGNIHKIGTSFQNLVCADIAGIEERRSEYTKADAGKSA